MSFSKIKNLNPWRKLALVTWKAPGDPSVYAQYEFDATNALHYIGQYNKKNGSKVTITHLVAKAIGLTMAKYPSLNGIIKWGSIYKRNSVDIFVQVAIPNDKDEQDESLSGAKICHIDKIKLKEIAEQLKHQASDIRIQKDPQFQKTFNLAKIIPLLFLRYLIMIHSFAVYNLNLNIPSLGIFPDPFGSAMLTSVGALGLPPGFAPIVPPSRCPFLICLGRTEDKAWVVDGKIQIRPITGFTATFDHRFMDGLIASRMFKVFMDILDKPEKYMS